MDKKKEVVVFWFRRDLRLEDNIGLYKALKSGYDVLPVFIFDTAILNQLEDSSDRRVDYIYQALVAINQELHSFDTSIRCVYSTVLDCFSSLIKEYCIKGVYFNEDYEPQAIHRDNTVADFLGEYRIPTFVYKDQVVFSKGEIVKKDGTPYRMYTPYAAVWRSKLNQYDLEYANQTYDFNLFCKGIVTVPSLDSMGFLPTTIHFEVPKLVDFDVTNYDLVRDYPAYNATSKLGIALRFGTISVRRCVAHGLTHNAVWLGQLIWREFFMQILYHFPHVATSCFNTQYEAIKWRNNEDEFYKWSEGKTGYPIVDAGMRELNATGYMHNRVRMIVASFLCKHLLIDWRWGEAYFAQKLDDYDLALNNGNWQWSAGSGCDAAPYFRVFNPSEQQRKFDKEGHYVAMWVPEVNTEMYCDVIVEHKMARDRSIETYKIALK